MSTHHRNRQRTLPPCRRAIPSFPRPNRAIRRLTGASADALVLFVPVASDAAASSSARTSLEGRDWRGRNDGGNDAGSDNQRADAANAGRAVRCRSADYRRAADFSGGLARTRQRAYKPAQYPAGTGAAGFLAAIHGGLRCNFRPNWQSLTLVRFNLLRSQQIG
jgi:hypothetical protein